MIPFGISSGMNAEHWYVIRVLSGQDFVAQENLGLQGFRSFFPRLSVLRRHARRVEVRKTLLFPRYAFVAFNKDHARWRAINGTRGVETLMTANAEPSAVPRGVVEELLALADEDGIVDFGRNLKPGSSVRFVSGPFAGTVGVLQRLDDNGRVEVLLNLLSSQVKVRAARGLLVPSIAS